MRKRCNWIFRHWGDRQREIEKKLNGQQTRFFLLAERISQAIYSLPSIDLLDASQNIGGGRMRAETSTQYFLMLLSSAWTFFPIAKDTVKGQYTRTLSQGFSLQFLLSNQRSIDNDFSETSKMVTAPKLTNGRTVWFGNGQADSSNCGVIPIGNESV